MVEDSGLFIDKFSDFPGVFSSFIYDSIGLSGILNLLENSTNRYAEYRTVTILQWKNKIWKSSGICKGTISNKELGEGGFGYDPIFIPLGKKNTFGQIKPSQKYKIDHRFKAFKKIKKFF